MGRIKWFSAVRAFGLILVLIYHLFYHILPGGFLGVDIFFTFSGFLITAQIIGEVRKKDGFDLFGFFKRRSQRITIPMLLMVAFTLPFALLISPDFIVGIAKQLAAVLSFTINWFYISAGLSYEAQMIPSLYLHTWSLAVTMQYYLVWGLACALMSALSWAVFKNSAAKRFIFFKMLVLVMSCAAAVLSFVHMRTAYGAGNDLNVIYFNTLSRLFPFFIGSFAAAVWGINSRQKAPRLSSKQTVAAVFALIAVIVSAALVIVANFSQRSFADDFIYRYGFLLTSLLTVILIYAAHGLHILTPSRTSEPWLLTALADMSFDLYLYHWPFYVIFSALFTDHNAASFTALALSLAFSALMVYGVHRVLIPIPKLESLLQHKRIAAAVCVPVVCATVISCIVISKAPAITSIEKDFAASYITQDSHELVSLKNHVDAINQFPVIYAIDNVPLQANILETPKPIQTPSPTPNPTPTPASSPPIGGTPTRSPNVTPTPSRTATPEEPVSIDVTGGITVIGDSVTVGASAALMNILPDCYIDAVVGRPVSAGLGIMTDLQDRGELGEYVVIALGTNGTDAYAQLLTQIIDALEPGHKLIFVTPYDGRENSNAKAAAATALWMMDLPAAYDFITVADWRSLIEPQSHLLAKDKVHIESQASQQLFANCVAKAIKAASSKPAK